MATITAGMVAAYRRYHSLARAVGAACRLHHAATPLVTRQPCPFSAGDCSKAALAAAADIGVRAVPAMISGMARCGGPGVDKAEWCIRAGH